MPKERRTAWTGGFLLLPIGEGIADGDRADYLVIEEHAQNLPPARAKPHRFAYVLSISPTPQLGLSPWVLPRNLTSRLSVNRSRCAAQYRSSEPISSSGAPAEFGYRQTRSPPTRHVPQWHSSASSTLPSSLPRLHLPAEMPRGEARLYRLEIVQHPLKAAEFGSSPLTRLPLAPPLVAQLHYRDRTTPDDMDENDFPFLIAHLALYNADGSTAVDVIGPGGQTPSQQRLYGNLVSSPHALRNLQGRLGIYFLFPDVSIRWRGRFTLSVTLMRIPRVDPTRSPVNVAEQGTVLAQARSHVFDVYPREEYIAPGACWNPSLPRLMAHDALIWITAQTPLTQYFLQQGVRISRLPHS
ncbi:velvet factor-domain-containing protein [Cytidiella melzeri]|nr:velvet factor-domain-containing protein [Cytidiella melzeri]